MRPAKDKLVVAIYGRSASGKTTIAKEVSQALDCGSLHCGERVREEAHHLNVRIPDLPIETHRQIDADTRAQAAAVTETFVIDGSFLDAVLAPAPWLLLILLECDVDERRSRFDHRAGTPQPNGLELRDKADDTDRARLYSSPPMKPALTIDTTGLSIENCVSRVRDAIDERDAS